MTFEQAITAMRQGKRCRCDRYPEYEYFVRDGRLGHLFNGISTPSAFAGIIDAEWHVIEPPPPLPRRFRAKYKGEAVVGAQFSGCIMSLGAQWVIPSDLTDIEWIDP
jgi:hypothetical protein